MSTLKVKTARALSGEPVSLGAEPCDELTELTGIRGRVCGNECEGCEFPAVYEDGKVTAILTAPAGEFDLEPVFGSPKTAVTVGDTSFGDRFDIMINGKPFTSYVHDGSLAKPYLGPVLTSFGESFTRLDFETKEHPHHRSVFFGVGDVTLDGGPEHVDFWNEPENCGIQRHTGIKDVISNNVYASFTACTQWCSHDGVPMADAECEYRFYAQGSDARYIDIALTFTASYGGVTFGKTKEAGPLGIRVADVLRAERGGYIGNSYGAAGERECWGRAANWCVYGGELSGHKIGIAVFDDKKNERYPTSWHVRDYGLFAANNLYFKGPVRIESGERLTYRYRLVFFEGTPETARLKDRFIVYVG